MLNIVRYVCPAPQSLAERHAVREQVANVLRQLIEQGVVLRRKSGAANSPVSYCWKP